MSKIEENISIENDLREQAFLLQFDGNEDEVRRQFGYNPFCYYGCPVTDLKMTGLFGVLDALIDLELTSDEIMNFYIHGHIEPYTDPYEFTKGIINIVHGMTESEIKEEYGRYFKDERISKISNLNRNTQMLLSFCYDEKDTYVFIPNKDDLYNRFSEIYDREYHHRDHFINEKEFQKIDGKLFRAVRFLVRYGYDFPNLEDLFNEEKKQLVFKETHGENTFVLDKEYASEMSNSLLSVIYFLKRYYYEFMNPEKLKNLFNLEYDSFVLRDCKDNQILFNRSSLVPNLIQYSAFLENLDSLDWEVPNPISLCDKREETIHLCFPKSSNKKLSVSVKRDLLFSISQELLKMIGQGVYLGFDFPDSEHLFTINQKFIKVIDPNGNEQSVLCEQFGGLLNIISQCKQFHFQVNYNQLFDFKETIIELEDMEGKKASIPRDCILSMMDLFSLLTKNGYQFKDYDTLFNEKEPFIVSYVGQNEEKILSRKQINKIINLSKLSSEQKKSLTDKEIELLSMFENIEMSKRLFEWLPFTAKKWIPSSAVIKKIPTEKSYEYFHNRNHERLKILKEAYQIKNYEEMEGLISLGYILGLFDSKESTSEKAMNYILDNFFKKGITADELHTTFGAIDLSKGYDKKFADFFMQHFAHDQASFIEPDLGVNMVGELFARFDEVLTSRPEKRIKTRTINKLLTPIDAMAVLTHVEIDKELLGEKITDECYVRLVQLLTKFGATKAEIKWAIELYKQALLLDEQSLSIPPILDVKASFMQFTSHLKSDPQAFLSGRKTNCCSKYGGFAQDRLTHVITDPDWRYVTFTSPNKTFFDGLVWYDKEEKVVCIDNVEGQFTSVDKRNPQSVALMADTVIRYADGIYSKMHELKIPCRKVNVGNDSGTASYKIFRYALEQHLIFEDKNPCDYPKRNKISTDANAQFTLTDENILRLRRKF